MSNRNKARHQTLREQMGEVFPNTHAARQIPPLRRRLSVTWTTVLIVGWASAIIVMAGLLLRKIAGF